MFENIRLDIFLISFCIGIGLVYIFSPPPQIVMKFPSPQNAGDIKYEDENKNCYRYNSEKVSCENSKNEVVDQPVLENFKHL